MGEQVCGRYRSVGGWAVIRDWQEGTSLLPSSTAAHTHHCFPPPRITLSNKRVTSANTCCSVMSYFLQPHGLQHTRFPCPSPSPGVCSSSCPLNQWCYLTVSSSAPLFSHLQSFPESGSFPMSQFVASGGQSIGALASESFPTSPETLSLRFALVLVHRGWAFSITSKAVMVFVLWCFEFSCRPWLTLASVPVMDKFLKPQSQIARLLNAGTVRHDP